MKKDSEVVSVSPDMTVGELLSCYPGSERVLARHGFFCSGCYVASWETLKEGAIAHGADLIRIIEDLNSGHMAGEA